ncbi:hypothetical protein SAMN05216559_1334 [Halomicrobium zhouii]|uniref:Uncharacterized protein n=1 Tax=Halomicrobium zhouii TaxID=767519 RepID=A0A1I6KQZ3_9EURY|nr:hypothetical protein [Halomicrobium zhouii]SFR93614.1 hypothetical protein SAMN05216559_1334 [Halomicrobium zhouii]
MPRIRPEFDAGARGRPTSLATAGRVLTRAGTVVALTAAPLALVTFLLVLGDAPTMDAGLDSAVAATTGPLAMGGGLGWLLHVAVLGVLAGTWVVGAGLVVSGLAD